MRLVYASLTSLLALACLAGAAPPEPALVARDARRASVAACNAYDAAVRMGVAKADEHADYACAATRGICADVATDEP